MALAVGLIGLKGHQGTILNGVQAMDDARLVAVCDDNESTLAGVARFAARSTFHAAPRAIQREGSASSKPPPDAPYAGGPNFSTETRPVRALHAETRLGFQRSSVIQRTPPAETAIPRGFTSRSGTYLPA